MHISLWPNNFFREITGAKLFQHASPLPEISAVGSVQSKFVTYIQMSISYISLNIILLFKASSIAERQAERIFLSCYPIRDTVIHHIYCCHSITEEFFCFPQNFSDVKF